MNNIENNLQTREAPVQHEKKPWHAVIAGFGCGIPTLVIIFLITSFAVLFFLATNEAQLTKWSQMNREDALHSLNVFISIVSSMSILLAMNVAFFVGRTAYHHSHTPQATPRLLKSIFAGIGFGLLSSVIGFLGGVVLEIPTFFPIDYSFGESAFGLMILIPVIVSILGAILGSIFGAGIVFRRLLQKEIAIINVKKD